MRNNAKSITAVCLTVVLIIAAATGYIVLTKCSTGTAKTALTENWDKDYNNQVEELPKKP